MHDCAVGVERWPEAPAPGRRAPLSVVECVFQHFHFFCGSAPLYCLSLVLSVNLTSAELLLPSEWLLLNYCEVRNRRL